MFSHFSELENAEKYCPNLNPQFTPYPIICIDSLSQIFVFLQSGEKLDKIELAFRKFDKNQDGFLSKEEFDVVSFILNKGRLQCYYQM